MCQRQRLVVYLPSAVFLTVVAVQVDHVGERPGGAEVAETVE